MNSNVFYIGGALVHKMTITPNGILNENITDNITGVANDTVLRCMIGVSDNFPNKVWFYYYDRSGSIYNNKHLVKYESSNYTYMRAINSDEGFLTMKIITSPNDGNIVYLGKVIPVKYNQTSNTIVNISSNYLGRSENAATPTDFLHSDIRDMEILNIGGLDRLFVGHDGGVAWGEAAGGACGTNMFCWHQISDDGTNGLQTNEFYGISISNSDNIVIQGGTQDCSSYIYDESTGNWLHAASSDGLEGAVYSNNQNWVITGSGVSSYLYQTYDISNPSMFPYSLTTSSITGRLSNRAKLDPTNQNILYIGAEKLYKINNCFSSTHSQFLFGTPVHEGSRISTFAIAKNNSLIKYIAEITDGISNSNHMWRYNTGTSNWIDISANLSQYINSSATDIITNPLNDLEVWICLGQTTNENKKVFHSTDGGTHWSELCLGYPSGIPANRLLFDHVTSTLYVATDVGIFRWEVFRPESGWVYISETMPFKLVTDIERDYINNRLIVGTFGRGIWEGILPEDNCYDENPLYISNSVNWNIAQTICKDVIVQNGGYLTISADILLSKGATLFIENGATVMITGGHLYNGNTLVHNGGSFTIINNGSIELSNGDEFKTEIGAIIDLTYGSVNLY